MTSSSPWRSDFGIFKNKPITNHYEKKEDREVWKVFAQDERKSYECSNYGRFRRVYKTKKVIFEPIRDYQYKKDNYALIVNITINGTRDRLNAKKVIAEVFIRPLNENELVISKNNKVDDLRVSNLFITTKQVQGKLTGYLTKKCRKIVYTDKAGFKHVFRSVRYAGKELGISYQTVLDTCNKKIKRPKFDLRFQEEQETI